MRRLKLYIPKRKIISVDFDGTIHKGEKYPFIGEPNTELIEYIKKTKHKYIWILNTCRHDKQLKYATDWLKEQGLEFDIINQNYPPNIAEYGDCRKIFADIYIDSNARTPEQFLQEEGNNNAEAANVACGDT